MNDDAKEMAPPERPRDFRDGSTLRCGACRTPIAMRTSICPGCAVPLSSTVIVNIATPPDARVEVHGFILLGRGERRRIEFVA